jgi:L-aminopeptidase/D-esterase-like protein
VVLARGGAVGGVDVRGGGPGTRETDLLNPTTLIDRIDAVVLTGGSAYGLAAANGVMEGSSSWNRVASRSGASSGGSDRSGGSHLRSWSRRRVQQPANA